MPWFYSWGAEPLTGFEALPDDTAFVPMSWGRNAPANHQSTWLSGSQAGRYETLLGFNEPDLASQSNLSVGDALDLWPLLEATGLRLGSPAAANPGNGWLSDFMAGATERELRVDFLAVHRYGGADPRAFLDHLDGLHDEYGLPIWITEFAVRDGTATTPEENRFTDQQVYNFMADVLPALEERDYVERYAWFPSDRDNAFVTSSALFESNGELTKLGRLYRGEPELTFDSGALLNGGFESPRSDPPLFSGSSPDDWATPSGATEVRATYANTGRQSLRLEPGLESGQARPAIARQSFAVGTDVEANTRYSLGAWVFHPDSDPLTGTREASLRVQWFDSDGTLLGDERATVLDATTPTDQWSFVTLEDVLIPNDSTIDEVRATLWVNNVGSTSVNSGAAYFDDVIFVQGASIPLWGDFNHDGAVNAADYTLWRDSEGIAGRGLPADGDGNEVVDEADYRLWAVNYGILRGSSAVRVPEPASGALLAAGACLAAINSCRCSSTHRPLITRRVAEYLTTAKSPRLPHPAGDGGSANSQRCPSSAKTSALAAAGELSGVGPPSAISNGPATDGGRFRPRGGLTTRTQ